MISVFLIRQEAAKEEVPRKVQRPSDPDCRILREDGIGRISAQEARDRAARLGRKVWQPPEATGRHSHPHLRRPPAERRNPEAASTDRGPLKWQSQKGGRQLPPAKNKAYRGTPSSGTICAGSVGSWAIRSGPAKGRRDFSALTAASLEQRHEYSDYPVAPGTTRGRLQTDPDDVILNEDFLQLEFDTLEYEVTK